MFDVICGYFGAGRTLESEHMPEEELCAPWKPVVLDSKKKRKTPKDNNSDEGPKRKKKKSEGQLNSTKRPKPIRVAFKVIMETVT